MNSSVNGASLGYLEWWINFQRLSLDFWFICRDNFLNVDVYFAQLKYQSVKQIKAYDLVQFMGKCLSLFFSNLNFPPWIAYFFCLICLICLMFPNSQLPLPFNFNLNFNFEFDKLYLYIWYILTSVSGILCEHWAF